MAVRLAEARTTRDHVQEARHGEADLGVGRGEVGGHVTDQLGQSATQPVDDGRQHLSLPGSGIHHHLI
ncbi:MAG: hypothetical protein U0667_01175 [Chloroflexota bacterium]